MALEILAPAGGEEQLIAAVRSGANAVYLGTKNFNARRNASNFDGEALQRAVAYCHGRGVKVHVTCNTLVTDGELPALYEEIRSIAASGADAVIVQDLAVAALFRRVCPEMPLHASTQMTIHNAEGAIMAQRLGFSRVVLAREVSLEEIRAIRKRCDIELEVFVHGALCMSVSGQCWMSSMLGGRSGNRGLCAQPCRLNFKAKGREYALSLKDLSAVEHIAALEEAGVCSLKIEGRMKRPEYVAAATRACRAAADGEKPDLETLRAVFSRSGFTDGYLRGKRTVDMFGIRTKEDVQAASEVMGELAATYRSERQSVPVDMAFAARFGSPVSLTVSDGERCMTVYGEEPQAARSRGLDHETAAKNLEKTGGTPFYVRKLDTQLDEGCYLAPAQLNALRREALEALLGERSALRPKPVAEAPATAKREKRSCRPQLRLRFETVAQIFDEADEAEYVYLPYGEIDEALLRRFGAKLIAELPRYIPEGSGAGIVARLKELKTLGLEKGCAGNIGDFLLLEEAGLRVFGGFSLNVLNSGTVEELEKLGAEDVVLSFETAMKHAPWIGGRSVGVMAYGYLPLMLFRACPMKAKNGCGNCSGRETMTDRTGTDFTVLCGGKIYSTLLNSLPLYIGDKAVSGVDFELLYYTTESSRRCAEVYHLFRAGAEFDGKRTGGLYYRELL